MTVKEIEERVATIKQKGEEDGDGDDSTAHGMEDELRTEVLTVIAAGAENAKEIAAAALTTSALDFRRWTS